MKLYVRFHEAQTAFRTALCDSFNTPEALDTLRDLVSRTNVYINARGANLEISVVERIARWVGSMLRMFGLGEGESSEIGWGQETTGEGNVNVSLHGAYDVMSGDLIVSHLLQREEILMPYLRTLSSFRDGVRKVAIAKGDQALKDILALSDRLRDVDLVPLGVALDDQEGNPCFCACAAEQHVHLDSYSTDGRALVKLVPPTELIKARDEKRAQEQAKAARKAAAVEAERQKKLQKLEKGRVPPQELFRPPHVPEGTYGSWNADGIPLTDGDGTELSKNQAKKVTKEWTAQKRMHEEFLAWQRDSQQ